MKQLRPSLSLCLLLAAPAAAQSNLVLSGTAGTDDIRLQIGPGAGELRVFGAAGVPDGSLFLGVQEVRLDTGAEDDTVTLAGSLTATLRFDLLTGTGSDQVFSQFTIPATPGTDPIFAFVHVDAGSGDDELIHQLVNQRNTFALDTRFVGGAGTDTLQLSMDASALTVDRQAVFIDADPGTEADSVDVNVASAATLALLQMSTEASAESESVSAVWNQTRTGIVLTEFDLLSGSVSIDLLGQTSFFVPGGRILGGVLDDNLSLNIGGVAVILNLTLDGGFGQDSIELLCGRNLWGAPVLAGGLGDDALKLIVEGLQILDLGIPLIDGGPGIDLADAPNVIATIINCEE